MQAPGVPCGSAIHFLLRVPYWTQASYQPPYLPPRYVARSVRSTSLSGNLCGSSLVPMMMSGPAPTLAATAALGRTSSQLSLSTRTSMPVVSVNFLVISVHLSQSPWTNWLQRNMRSLAPFSGSSLKAVCASTGVADTNPPPAATAVAATPALRTSLLVRSDIAFLPRLRSLIGFDCRRAPIAAQTIELASTESV